MPANESKRGKTLEEAAQETAVELTWGEYCGFHCMELGVFCHDKEHSKWCGQTCSECGNNQPPPALSDVPLRGEIFCPTLFFVKHRSFANRWEAVLFF